MGDKLSSANDVVESHLAGNLAEMERMLRGDCLAYVGPIAFAADDDIRDAVEKKKGEIIRKGFC
jgi:hypothetical protein